MSSRTPTQRKSPPWRVSRKLIGFLFVLPSVVFVLVMLVTPLCVTIWMSLHKWPLFGEIVFALVENDFLQKQSSDSIEDFENVFQFREAFERGFDIQLDRN